MYWIYQIIDELLTIYKVKWMTFTKYIEKIGLGCVGRNWSGRVGTKYFFL